jgi:hypothetical protein
LKSPQDGLRAAGGSIGGASTPQAAVLPFAAIDLIRPAIPIPIASCDRRGRMPARL